MPPKHTLLISIIAFLVLLISCHAADPQPHKDIICVDGNCYPRIFQPTNEFQVVKEGQEVPPGLHIRMDFTTGLKEAKLIDPTDTTDTAVVVIDTDNGNVVHTTDQAVNPTLHHPSDLEAVTDPSLPPVGKAAANPKYLSTVGDDDLYDACVLVLADTNTTSAEAALALEGLEELVHQIDMGVKFGEGQGIVTVMKWLDDADKAVRSAAAIVIGAAVQNNPTAQHAALTASLFDVLVSKMAQEPDTMVLTRLLYAFSNLVRGNSPAIKRILYQPAHLTILGKTYDSILSFSSSSTTLGDEFARKCAILLADVLNPDMGGAIPSDPTPSERSSPPALVVQEDAAGFTTDADVRSSRQRPLKAWQRRFEVAVVGAVGARGKERALDDREKIVMAAVAIKEWVVGGVFDDSFVAWAKGQRRWVEALEDQEGMEEYAKLLEVVVRG
ncbi:hypothetical protein BC938DRAFT_472500 [Jimgerdemannia flammicorona]|uniref:Nucleotide exchange factor SIL1 n=1 Tax=Jimgerdemannia flammicorona TaxID=994334 RepID=A0A433Q5Z8_9FUNG|nr:hypothetical protein BC938DRAFT_472500 [Jimgerdemannia flammicorona]